MSLECKVCGAESTVGLIGVTDGKVTHEHLCDTHYYKLKMGEPQEVQKREPTPTEKRIKKLGFRIKTINKGQQLVLKHRSTVVDFWPVSEKFFVRNTGVSGTGVFDLAGHI
jgi:hypothetical protein